MKLQAKETFVKRIGLVLTSKLKTSQIKNHANWLSQFCNVTPQAARKWLLGMSMPDYDNMKLIASKLDVSTSYLIGEINIKSFSKNNNSSLLNNNLRNSVITLEITEDIFAGELIAGDTAICHPCDSLSIDNAIYLLQNSNQKFFRRLSFDKDKNLVIKYEIDGIPQEDIYRDKNLIDLFLSSLIGRVESFIRIL